MKTPPQDLAILLLLLIVHLCAAAYQNATTTTNRPDEFHVGVILEMDSLVGKVSRASISLAVNDFYSVHRNHSTKLVLHFRDSTGSNVQAASAGISSIYITVRVSHS
jgi:glutamate receptor, ionotropic, plant